MCISFKFCIIYSVMVSLAMDIEVYYVVYLASPCEGKDEQEEEEKGAG